MASSKNIIQIGNHKYMLKRTISEKEKQAIEKNNQCDKYFLIKKTRIEGRYKLYIRTSTKQD